MSGWDDFRISKAITSAYSDKIAAHLESDVIIVGAGPSGLTAAYELAERGHRVTVVEKRLSPGGGIWGGAMGWNYVVVQDEALPVLEAAGVRADRKHEGLRTVDAMELAAALTVKAVRSGAGILNLTFVEDLCVHDGRVVGTVVNRTGVGNALPVDPLTLSGRAVIDATGHDAGVVQMLRKRGLVADPASAGNFGEAPMNAVEGERFVVDRVAELYPGLWVCGMAVCAVFGGPRMGPIFGGMLLSGRAVAEKVAASL
jgi:thiamine thiazole synthase